MKRHITFLTLALVAVLLAGCSMFENKSYTAADLQGTWTEDQNPLCYWVYTSTKDASGEYFWGKTWDEADDVHESDLEFHGNGWFKWEVNGTTLKQLHVMEISDALVPKTYTIASCNSTTLVLKDSYGTRITYNKVK